MDPGHVRTMRGAILNMPELRLKSKKPEQSNVDHKDKIQLRKEPPKVNNIRGFIPSMEGVAVRSGSRHEKVAAKIEALPEEDKPTLADMTGVIVDRPFVPGQNKSEDPVATAGEVLKGIIDNIPKGRKLDDTPRRRSKQS